MRKFNFSLQKVLEINKQMLNNLKLELTNLIYQVANIETDIENLNNKYSAINKEFIEKSAVSVTVEEIAYYKMLMLNILRKAEEKDEYREILNGKAEDKRNEILNMNKEVSALEKLRDKKMEEYNISVKKSEEIFIEEFVSANRLGENYAY